MPQNVPIQFRRGTAALWTSTNPVLSAGETGYETDTKRTKIGDGASAWTILSYTDAAGVAAIPATQKGSANGVASLDGTGKVPSAQLPTAAAAVSSVAGKTGVVTLAVEDLTNGAALNTTIANKFALPTQSYNAATNTPAITQGSALTVGGNRVFSVQCSVGSTSSAGPFSTVAVNDILTDNGTGTWSRNPAPPITNYPICGDGLGGERAGVPGVDFAMPMTLTATVPVSSRPTGITVGANGTLTTAPYAAVYGPTGGVAGVWAWFAANDLWSGNVAGYYWCVMTSATAGTAYQDRYTPGVNTGANTSSNHSWLPPATPTAIVGAGAGTPLAADGTRRSFFAIPMDGSAGNLPIGYMSVSGWAETEAMATYPSSTNNKAISTSLSSTAAGAANQIGISTSTATTSFTLFNVRGKISNRNSQASQIAAAPSSTGAETWFGNSNPTKTTVNTAAACFYTLDALSAAEYIVIERAFMRVSPN
jgi:hypothetical protein